MRIQTLSEFHMKTSDPTLISHGRCMLPKTCDKLFNELSFLIYEDLCFFFFPGFPNVGKSSIINSIKKDRVCDVGPARGVTK